MKSGPPLFTLVNSLSVLPPWQGRYLRKGSFSAIAILPCSIFV
jgi:hypothetical protein